VRTVSGAALAALLMLGACSSTEHVSTTPSPLTSAERAELASAFITDLNRSLDDGDPSELSSGAATEAASELLDLTRNISSLVLTDISFRYIGEATLQDGDGTHRWPIITEVSWRESGEQLRAEVPLLLAADEGEVHLASLRVPEAEHVPLWFLGRISVERSAGVRVASLEGSGIPGLRILAGRAVEQVDSVVEGADLALAVDVPATLDEFAQLLGAQPEQVQALAAVTIGLFGADASHIVLNPDVFGDLGPVAAQIVMTHEAAHVALDAAGSGMPMWLMEGYADYVALVDSGVPVEVSAAQALGRARAKGAPQRLPGPADFDTSTHGVGAAYEFAWLACRLLAAEYGRDRLLEFYRAVDVADDDGQPIQEVLGISLAEFTRQWRDYVAALAESTRE
jgi:hypothetical protein